MLYALLCYNDEAAVTAWTAEEEAAVMARLDGVRRKWAASFRPMIRLMPTTAATTLRDGLVLDGPSAGAREQLLALYLVEADALDAALAIARDLAGASPGGAHEIRPVLAWRPDGSAPDG